MHVPAERKAALRGRNGIEVCGTAREKTDEGGGRDERGKTAETHGGPLNLAMWAGLPEKPDDQCSDRSVQVRMARGLCQIKSEGRPCAAWPRSLPSVGVWRLR